MLAESLDTIHRPSPPPATLYVCGLVKRYRAGAACCTALDAVALRVCPGDCVLIAGDSERGRVGPRTLLWCVAGIVRPTTGAICWRAEGVVQPPPARQLVAMDAPLPASWRAGDVLQAAVPAGTSQTDADQLVDLACGDCALDAAQPVHSMSAASRWRLQLARGVASGASWLLLDLPGPGAVEYSGEDFIRGRVALERVGRRVRGRGGAVIAAADGNGPLDDALLCARRFIVAAGGVLRADDERVSRRVAEPGAGTRSVDLLA